MNAQISAEKEPRMSMSTPRPSRVLTLTLEGRTFEISRYEDGEHDHHWEVDEPARNVNLAGTSTLQAALMEAAHEVLGEEAFS